MVTSGQKHIQCADITRAGAACQLKLLLTTSTIAVDKFRFLFFTVVLGWCLIKKLMARVVCPSRLLSDKNKIAVKMTFHSNTCMYETKTYMHVLFKCISQCLISISCFH